MDGTARVPSIGKTRCTVEHCEGCALHRLVVGNSLPPADSSRGGSYEWERKGFFAVNGNADKVRSIKSESLGSRLVRACPSSLLAVGHGPTSLDPYRITVMSLSLTLAPTLQQDGSWWEDCERPCAVTSPRHRRCTHWHWRAPSRSRTQQSFSVEITQMSCPLDE